MSTRSSPASSAPFEDYLAFARDFPLPDIAAERFLRHLASPAAILDFRDTGDLAVILDRIADREGLAPFVLVGHVGGEFTVEKATPLLSTAETRARSLGLKGLELALSGPWRSLSYWLARQGWRLAYTDLDMICHDPAWGDDHPLPPGYGWRDAFPDRVEDYYRLLVAGFRDSPGAFLPDREEVARYLKDPDIAARLLTTIDGPAIALLRYTRSEAYINAILRDPARRRQGLGRLVLDEARRALRGRTLRLSVVAENEPACRLYRACGFTVEKSVPAYRRFFG